MPPFLDPLERLILIRDGFYSPDARTHTRAAAILALDYGHPLRRVARSVRCDHTTLYHWLDRYLEKRDVAALGDGRTRDVRRRTRRLKPARAAALLELAHAAPPAEPPRLPLDPPARDALARLATDAEPDPTRRYWAALLFAYDRRVPVTDIARVAGCDRRTVREARARHLPRLLADGAGQGA